MYHLELRKFPKRVHRFNMSGQQIGEVLLRWVQDQTVELGEQRWKPYEAEITVLEGPEVSSAETSLGRGWRRAEKEGRDVTEQVLAEARAHVGGTGAQAPRVAAGAEAVIGGGGEEMALAMQLGSLLGPEAVRLMDAWRAVRARRPALAPSEALAAAERELQGR